MPSFEEALQKRAKETETAIERLLPAQSGDRLRDAMRYAMLGGGKRLRPFLVMESAALFGVDPASAIRVAVALECVHCFSLVHDDLPAMDDDDLRRGRATTHIEYDEATAILAGDALLAHAFTLIAHPETHENPAVRSELIAALADATGDNGMCGGQMRDIEGETNALNEDEIIHMQSLKTGALFRFACMSGAIMAQASKDERDALDIFARGLGAVFQIADDLLDEEASTEQLGKTAGKDRDSGKATLPALLGKERARAIMTEHAEAARGALAVFGDRGAMLRAALEFSANRTS